MNWNPFRRQLKASAKHRSFRPALEALETRTVPTLGLTQGFVPLEAIPNSNGANPVAVADFNGDGKNDVATLEADYSPSGPGIGPNLNAYLNVAGGEFSAAIHILRKEELIFNIGNPVAGDFNGDGKMDVAVGVVRIGDVYSAAIEVFIGNGQGVFATEPLRTEIYADDGDIAGIREIRTAFVAANLNGDAATDLVAAGNKYSAEGASIPFVFSFVANGGTFSITDNFVPIALSDFPFQGTPGVGDFDGDARADVALFGYGDDTIYVCKGDGGGGFSLMSGFPITMAGTTGQPDRTRFGVGNFVGDATTDLAFFAGTYQGPDPYRIVLMQGGTNGLRAVSTTPLDFGELDLGWPAPFDVDQNGYDDLLASVDGVGTFAYLSDGQGHLTRGEPLHGLINRDAIVGDFNADLVPDVAVANYFPIGDPNARPALTILFNDAQRPHVDPGVHLLDSQFVALPDVDGEWVIVASDKPIFTAANLSKVLKVRSAGAGFQITKIDLANSAKDGDVRVFVGTDDAITRHFELFHSFESLAKFYALRSVAPPQPGQRDYQVNVGAIVSTAAMYRIDVAGDLGRIDVKGKADAAALIQLNIGSLSELGTATQDKGGSVDSKVTGTLVNLNIAGNCKGILKVTGTQKLLGYDVSGIGVGVIGGALTGRIETTNIVRSLTVNEIRGGDGPQSGSIKCSKYLGLLEVTQDVKGGIGKQSGSVTVNDTAQKITIHGSIVGDDGDESGQVFVSKNLVEMTVGGDVWGGDGKWSGRIRAGALDQLTIQGHLVGGFGDYSGFVFASVLGQLDAHNLYGGNGLSSGSIVVDGADAKAPAGNPKAPPIAATKITINGSILGGLGKESGQVKVSKMLKEILITEHVQGGDGDKTKPNSGRIYADHVQKLTILGFLRGGKAKDSGSVIVNAGDLTEASIGAIYGGEGEGSGRVSVAKVLGDLRIKGNADMAMAGDIRGGSGQNSKYSGQVVAGTISFIDVANDVIGGDGKYSGLVGAKKTLTFGNVHGMIFGGVGGGSGRVDAPKASIGHLYVGRLIGGSGIYSGYIDASSVTSKIQISEDIFGGGGAASGRIHVKGKVNTIVVEGDVIGGAGLSTGVIGSDAEIESLVIYGALVAGPGESSGRVAAKTIGYDPGPKYPESGREYGYYLHIRKGILFVAGAGKYSGTINADKVTLAYVTVAAQASGYQPLDVNGVPLVIAASTGADVISRGSGNVISRGSGNVISHGSGNLHDLQAVPRSSIKPNPPEPKS